MEALKVVFKGKPCAHKPSARRSWRFGRRSTSSSAAPAGWSGCPLAGCIMRRKLCPAARCSRRGWSSWRTSVVACKYRSSSSDVAQLLGICPQQFGDRIECRQPCGHTGPISITHKTELFCTAIDLADLVPPSTCADVTQYVITIGAQISTPGCISPPGPRQPLLPLHITTMHVEWSTGRDGSGYRLEQTLGTSLINQQIVAEIGMGKQPRGAEAGGEAQLANTAPLLGRSDPDQHPSGLRKANLN